MMLQLLDLQQRCVGGLSLQDRHIVAERVERTDHDAVRHCNNAGYVCPGGWCQRFHTS